MPSPGGIAAGLILAVRGSASTPARIETTWTKASDAGDELTCQKMLERDEFGGDGTVVVATEGKDRRCTVEFRAKDDALARLGIRVDCPPEASVLIAFDLRGSE